MKASAQSIAKEWNDMVRKKNEVGKGTVEDAVNLLFDRQALLFKMMIVVCEKMPVFPREGLTQSESEEIAKGVPLGR